MKLTIFDVYVPMQDQEPCDRMKQVCVDNNLLNGEISTDFKLDWQYKYFLYDDSGTFFIDSETQSKTQVTEAEFLTLLNEYKKTLE